MILRSKSDNEGYFHIPQSDRQDFQLEDKEKEEKSNAAEKALENIKKKIEKS
ncbi:hypothetical protein [Oceanobacillus picturae]|uniref:hypothetical protein n=1 Tax=Oceanobacillus picturae TaxID=171693 RepID=UPI001601389D|nr:hypothetical protein [Oceanobacillus picturae]